MRKPKQARGKQRWKCVFMHEGAMGDFIIVP